MDHWSSINKKCSGQERRGRGSFCCLHWKTALQTNQSRATPRWLFPSKQKAASDLDPWTGGSYKPLEKTRARDKKQPQQAVPEPWGGQVGSTGKGGRGQISTSSPGVGLSRVGRRVSGRGAYPVAPASQRHKKAKQCRRCRRVLILCGCTEGLPSRLPHDISPSPLPARNEWEGQ